MTIKRIVYERPDGGVSIVIPAPEFVARFKDESEAISVIMAKDVPVDATNIIICNATDLPKQENFRDAWERFGVSVRVNMQKAQAMHMNDIRSMRNKKLSELDVLQMRAIVGQKNDEINSIENDKQNLRDIPETFDLSQAKTPDDLKALWPDRLERPIYLRPGRR